jgi:hypothetical protein
MIYSLLYHLSRVFAPLIPSAASPASRLSSSLLSDLLLVTAHCYPMIGELAIALLALRGLEEVRSTYLLMGVFRIAARGVKVEKSRCGVAPNVRLEEAYNH